MSRRINLSKIILNIIFFFSLINIFIYSWVLYEVSGDGWLQGDWLINNFEVFVRRGSVGTIIITLGDLFHVDLLFLTIFIQALFAVVTICITWKVITDVNPSNRLFILLISPCFFVSAWLNNSYYMFLRKDSIMLLSFSLLSYGIFYHRLNKYIITASTMIFCFSVLANEAMSTYVFLFVAMLFICCKGKKRLFYNNLILLFFLMILFLALNLLPPPLTNVDLVCSPLLKRGFSESFCSGAIEATTGDLKYAINFSKMYSNYLGIYGIFIGYVIGFTPIVMYIKKDYVNLKLIIFLFIASIPIASLYVVAIDWGRWLVLHISAIIFFLLIKQKDDDSFLQETSLNNVVSFVLIILFLSLGGGFIDFQLVPGVIFIILSMTQALLSLYI